MVLLVQMPREDESIVLRHCEGFIGSRGRCHYLFQIIMQYTIMTMHSYRVCVKRSGSCAATPKKVRRQIFNQVVSNCGIVNQRKGAPGKR
jgi:hypothetical protein